MSSFPLGSIPTDLVRRRTSGTSVSVASIASSASTAGGRSFPEKLMVSQVLVNAMQRKIRMHTGLSFLLAPYSVVFIYILYSSLFTLDNSIPSPQYHSCRT